MFEKAVLRNVWLAEAGKEVEVLLQMYVEKVKGTKLSLQLPEMRPQQGSEIGFMSSFVPGQGKIAVMQMPSSILEW